MSTSQRKPWLAHEFEASDAAVVLATFPGTPYVVVTDGGKAANAPTRWPKVVAAGRPVVVERFRADADQAPAPESSGAGPPLIFPMGLVLGQPG